MARKRFSPSPPTPPSTGLGCFFFPMILRHLNEATQEKCAALVVESFEKTMSGLLVCLVEQLESKFSTDRTLHVLLLTSFAGGAYVVSGL